MPLRRAARRVRLLLLLEAVELTRYALQVPMHVATIGALCFLVAGVMMIGISFFPRTAASLAEVVLARLTEPLHLHLNEWQLLRAYGWATLIFAVAGQLTQRSGAGLPEE